MLNILNAGGKIINYFFEKKLSEKRNCEQQDAGYDAVKPRRLLDRIKFFVCVSILISAVSLYAQESAPAEYAPDTEAQGTETTQDVTATQESVITQDAAEPQNTETISYYLRRNKYFLESLRLKSLANLAIDEGEYEQSETYSSESMRYAQLSDEYINEQLKRQNALKAISNAREHLAWAKSAQAPKYYPDEYERANEHFAAAVAAQTAEDWDGALENALLVEQDLALVAAPPPEGEIPKDLPKFPAKYTVRPWDEFGDCFWNIAYWFYGDYYKWPVLYEANKEKLPDPNNPNLLEVGTIIDIPEIDEQVRIGMWDSGKPFKQ
jgi:nucleoid-associated protein YgaU